MTIGYYGKHITAERLVALLNELPKDIRLAVNRVGNLVVFDDNDTYLGYVDFLEGKLVLRSEIWK